MEVTDEELLAGLSVMVFERPARTNGDHPVRPRRCRGTARSRGIDSQVRVMSHELFRGHFLLIEKTLLSMRPTDVEPLEAGAR